MGTSCISPLLSTITTSAASVSGPEDDCNLDRSRAVNDNEFVHFRNSELATSTMNENHVLGRWRIAWERRLEDMDPVLFAFYAV